MALLGAVAKIGAGMLKGRKKKQTGGEVASKVTGGSYSVKANPNATNSELEAKIVIKNDKEKKEDSSPYDKIPKRY